MKPRTAALIAAGLLAGVPATAQADFLPPQPLSPTFYAAGTSIDIGIEDTGAGSAVWSSGTGGVYFRRRAPTSALGTLTTLSTEGSGESDVAVDPVTGRALATWVRIDPTTEAMLVRARFRNANGTFGATQTLSVSSSSIYNLRAGMNRAGQAAVAWLRHDGANYRAEVRTISENGVLAPTGTLSPAGDDANSLELAVDGAGNADVVWGRFDGEDVRTELAERRPDGSTAYVRTMSGAGVGTAGPQVEAEAAGGAIAAWYGNVNGQQRVQVRRLRPDGTLGSIQTVSGAASAHDPDLAIDAEGDAMIVWQAEPAAGSSVQLRSRRADGVVGPVQTIARGELPAVAVDRRGNPVVAWLRPASGGIGASFHGAAGPVQTVAAESMPGEERPALAENPDGDALVAFNQPDPEGAAGAARPVISAAPLP